MSKYTDNTRQFIRQLTELSKALKFITRDIAVMADDLFDQNFQNESFFGEPWRPSKYVDRENANRGKSRNLLQNKGHLRKSIRYNVSQNSILFYSNLPYADIHNAGGTINHPGGTAYFYNKKRGKAIWVSNRNAQRYERLYGDKMPRTKPHDIPIPQRQFVGDHKRLESEIAELIEKEIFKAFK